LHIISSADIDRPWLISSRYYGVDDYWWLILWFNDVSDPFSLNIGDRLVIPNATFVVQQAPPDITPPIQPRPIPVEIQFPQPYNSPYPATATPSAIPNDYIFNFGFNIWDATLTGLVSFQIQVASDPLFADIVMSSLSALQTSRWFYFNPNANGGTGAFVSIPPSGVDPVVNAGQPVYFQFQAGDPIQPGTQYYVQYRQWQPSAESSWQTVPPFAIIPLIS
jgi:hypothetical protein